MQVAAGNTEQARAWDGDEGAYWTEHAWRFDRSIARHHDRLMDAAALAPGDHVLDVGCGTGQTSRDAARAVVDGSVLGVDLSAGMTDLARRLAAEEGLRNVRFEQADAQVHDFPAAAFDAVISRTGTMFFADPVAAFGNLARALRPGGWLTMAVWQGPQANEWIREITGALAAGRDLPTPPPGAPGPFAFADPTRAPDLLTVAGFADVDVAGADAPMWFGADADDAQAFVVGLLGWMLRDLDEPTRDRALDALHETLAAHETDDGVLFGSAVWVVRARRADG
jgi:SAM-dependent methyltransferase